MLCNALIQPHFDYACSACYPNLNKNLTKKMQTAQNKCIRFSFGLENRSHVGINEFKTINWLPIQNRYGQCVSVSVFKFCKNLGPVYMSMYSLIEKTCTPRKSIYKLKLLLKPTNMGQNSASYIGPKIWNNLTNECKLKKIQTNNKYGVKTVLHMLAQKCGTI